MSELRHLSTEYLRGVVLAYRNAANIGAYIYPDEEVRVEKYKAEIKRRKKDAAKLAGKEVAGE